MSNAVKNDQDTSVYSIINAIVDEQSFVESDKFIKSVSSFGELSGDGVVSGFCLLDGIQTGIFATDHSALSGSIGKSNAAKIVKCINNAVKTNSPIVGIFDTCGARFSEGIEAMEGYCEIIKAFSDAYGVVPTICVTRGANFGLSSYLTAICDISVAYEKAQIATSSPLILAANTKLDAAKVGGAEAHAAKSGIVSAVVKSDAALRAYLVKFLNLISTQQESEDDANRVCKNLNEKTTIADTISAVVDKDSFIETRCAYAEGVTTGFARLDGVAVAVVGAYAKLTANGAVKISEILNTAESFGLPVINFVDCDGAENNIESENNALIREVASMMFAYNSLSVAKIAVICGKAIGLGYAAFAAKSVVDYSIAWKCASINTISDTSAANLLYGKEIAASKDRQKAESQLASAYGAENSAAMKVAEKGYIDNVIEPSLTRPYLIAAVQMFLEKQ